MLDIHCHILPGIDDGPATWEQSLEMAYLASEDGIRKIVATPHFIKGSYEPPVQEVLYLTEELNKRIKKENLDLEILPGMEVYLESDLPEMFRKGEILTLNNAKKYLLVEFPSDSIPSHSERVLYELRLQGIMPILAHADRNQVILQDPQKLFPLVESGLLTQVTTSSLEGHFGSKCQEIANLLLKHKLAHFIATDAHYNPHRMPRMKDVIQRIRANMPDIYESLKNYEGDFEAGRYIVPEDPVPLETEKKGFLARLRGTLLGLQKVK
ncbi:MAG: tyrosine-protein phosphatase [Peptococcales bacterium]|jgi:protein-tyrosine phosphatase